MSEPIETAATGIYRCPVCGLQNPRPISRPFRHGCGPKTPRPDLAPILARLAELTGHPEILDQPRSYARAAQLWAAGIPGELEPHECRDDSEVEFIQQLCQSSGCGKLRDGVCKPSCGPGMILAVKATMASEGCPWTCRRW